MELGVGQRRGDRTVRRAAPSLVVRARRSPVPGVWLVLEDVSELRRLQRIRAEFIDNLSHELRTPLTTISLLAETLTRDADATAVPPAPRCATGSPRSRSRPATWRRWSTSCWTSSRIESGGRQLLLDDVDLGAIARRAPSGCACSPSARASRWPSTCPSRAAARPRRRGAARPGARQPRSTTRSSSARTAARCASACGAATARS